MGFFLPCAHTGHFIINILFFSDLQSIAFTHTNGVALGMAMSVSWSKTLVQTDISATTGWIAMNIVDPLTMVRLTFVVLDGLTLILEQTFIYPTGGNSNAISDPLKFPLAPSSSHNLRPTSLYTLKNLLTFIESILVLDQGIQLINSN